MASIQPFNEKAARTWSSGGHAYEIIAQQCMSGIVHAIDRLDPHAGKNVLDVATGTGRAARETALRGAQVTGVDIAPGLLEVAREHAAREGHAIDFQQADAEALPFEDASFDGALSTFGVMFSVEPEAAAAELARVVKPGGHVAIIAWTPDSQALAMRQSLAPFGPPKPDPAPPPPWRWGSEEGVRDYLGEAFDLGHESGVVRLQYPDGEAFWRVFANGFGPVKAVADALDADRKSELADSMIRWSQPFRDALGITIPCDYMLTVGRRK